MVGQAWLNSSMRRLGAEFKWGLAGPEELSLGEPRWRVIDTHPVMERLGWPYDILWSWFRFFTGVRPYGIAHLKLLDRPEGPADRVFEGSCGVRRADSSLNDEADHECRRRCLGAQLFTRT